MSAHCGHDFGQLRVHAESDVARSADALDRATDPVCWAATRQEFRKPTPFLQTMLTIGAPREVYEQEADRVADRVTRGPQAAGAPPRISRNFAAREPEAQELQSTSGRDDGREVPALVHEVLGSPGRALDTPWRAYFELRFGRDFDQVRIHDDARASASARPVNALAYTHGRHIVFGAGAYSPGSDEGRRLLAHELTHVVQQGAAPAAATHSQAEAGDLGRSCGSQPAGLQRKPKSGKDQPGLVGLDSSDSPGSKACPPMERGEREEAAKAQLRLVERIPQQEWLIYGFPIGGSEISEDEAGRFISEIELSLMRGHFVYMAGQDPLEVLGFSDCFGGPRVDNHVLRQLRAAKFCAGVKNRYASTPKVYPSLIRSCEAAPADQYVSSNATRADRARNRSIMIRRVAAKVQLQDGYPHNPQYGPSEAHCAVYATELARTILGPVYANNGHCACLVTPDEPHNNCVRDCLQDKLWTLLANEYHSRKATDPPMDISIACPIIWTHHRDCYRDCGCASAFIDYLAFDAVCNIALPCAVNSAAINLLNRCMPPTKDDKYLPVR